MKRNNSQSQSQRNQTIYQTVITLPCDEHGFHTLWMSTDDIDDALMFTHLVVDALDRARVNCRVVTHSSDDPAMDVGPRDPEYRAALARALDVDTDDIPY